MGDWRVAKKRFGAALDADRGLSPIPCAQLLFERSMAETFSELDAVLPAGND
jgi:hypothetical protein